jgi:hypothetical protein
MGSTQVDRSQLRLYSNEDENLINEQNNPIQSFEVEL